MFRPVLEPAKTTKKDSLCIRKGITEICTDDNTNTIYKILASQQETKTENQPRLTEQVLFFSFWQVYLGVWKEANSNPFYFPLRIRIEIQQVDGEENTKRVSHSVEKPEKVI